MGTPVEIVPYDPVWPDVYSRLRRRLRDLLAGMVDSIEHIGSTSVPGLAAKPVIDVDVMLKQCDYMDDCRALLEAAGFEPRGSRYGDGVFAFMVRESLPGLRVYLCPPQCLTMRSEFVSATVFVRILLLQTPMRSLK